MVRVSASTECDYKWGRHFYSRSAVQTAGVTRVDIKGTPPPCTLHGASITDTPGKRMPACQRERPAVEVWLCLVLTTTYIPTSHVWPNATCALRRRPLPANACLAQPRECSQTDAIDWRQRKQICCCLLSTTWPWLISNTEDSVSALLAHCV